MQQKLIAATLVVLALCAALAGCGEKKRNWVIDFPLF